MHRMSERDSNGPVEHSLWRNLAMFLFPEEPVSEFSGERHFVGVGVRITCRPDIVAGQVSVEVPIGSTANIFGTDFDGRRPVATETHMGISEGVDRVKYFLGPKGQLVIESTDGKQKARYFIRPEE